MELPGRAIIDISMPLDESTPYWPMTNRFECRWLKSHEVDGYNESTISLNSHTGTHFDFPFHFLANGKKLRDLSLDLFIGKVYVVDCADASSIGVRELQNAGIPAGCKRVLLKTRNSTISRGSFNNAYVSLEQAGAVWLVQNGILLVGIDYLSIEAFGSAGEVHTTLLQHDVVILEGLLLETVAQGVYDLVALPLNVPNSEGVPTRAVLLGPRIWKDSQ